MGNSFDCAISPVEFRDLAACEDHLPCSVLGGWHETDRIPGECFGQFEVLSLEADPALLLDAPYLVLRGVFDSQQRPSFGQEFLRPYL